MIRCIYVLALVALGFSHPATAQEEWRDCDDCPVLITLDPGSFERKDSQNSENHLVTFSKSFAVSKLEITIMEFRNFIDATGYSPDSGCRMFATIPPEGIDDPDGGWQNPKYEALDDLPVACVSFRDAEAYVSWLSEVTGSVYRLPSEAEWEYAARAGNPNTSKWYTTGFAKTGEANCATCFGQDVMGREDLLRPFSVGGKPNKYGVLAMLGNVAEWTADCPGDSFSTAPDDGAARLDGNCTIRMARGGTFHHKWNELAGFRVPYSLDIRRNDIGIRVVREF